MSIEKNQDAREKAFIDDTEEARVRALAEKPFRDVAIDRPDTDRDVLERVADEQGDKAGQKYREQKESSPIEVIKRLAKELDEKLESETDPAQKRFGSYLLGTFLDFVRKYKTEKEIYEQKYSDKVVDVLFLKKMGVFNGFNVADANYPRKNSDNALYQALGLGETLPEVIKTFNNLSEQQKREAAEAIGERVGDATQTVDKAALFSLPTKIDGIFLEVFAHQKYKGPSLALRFTPEFLERAIKQI